MQASDKKNGYWSMLVIRVVCFFTKTQGTYWKATFLLAFTGKSFCCIDLRSRKI